MMPSPFPHRRRRPETLPSDAEIVIDWQRFADGRPWRMQRGVDFPTPGPAFRRAAERVAEVMGKRVIMVRDRLKPDDFIWIQFVDGEITIGDPCPCGGRRFVRLTGQLVRCRACRSTLIATPRESDDDEPAVVAPAKEPEVHESLANFRQVRLRRTEATSDAERYVGTGLDTDARPVLLAVRVPLVAGAPIPDSSSPTQYAHEVLLAVPHDVTADDDGADQWDIALE